MAIDTTYTDARENLAKLLDRVTGDREVVFIRRRGRERVALVAADELEGLMETAHLLRSPRNATRLLTALRRAIIAKTMQTVDIVAEGYDLAVRMSALDDSSLIARKVMDRRVSVAGSPEYFARHGRPGTPDELRRHNCLLLGSMEWRFAWPDSIRSVRVRGNWTSDNGTALTAAAVKGIGLARLAHYYFDDAVERGELELVLEDYEPKDSATWLIYPNRQYLPTRVRFLVDFLAERLQR